jgi:hypothetical protein
MAALQQSRFSIYDLQGFRRTQESLDQLLIRKDYRLSEATLEEKLTQPNKTLQKRKEELLTKACQELDLPSIIFEFKSLDLVNDRAAIDAFARVSMQEQKNLLDLMLAVRVNRKIADLLEKESAQIFAYNEQLKKSQLEIAAIVAQEGREAFFRDQNDLSVSKMQMEAQLFATRQNIHDDSMAKLNDIFKQVEKLSQQYSDIKEMRANNNKRHTDNIDHKIDNFEIEGQKVFSNEDKKVIQSNLGQQNQVKNQIEISDLEIQENQHIIIEANKDLHKNQVALKNLLHEIEIDKQNADPAEQAALNEYLDALSESAECELEEHLVAEELEHVHKEQQDCKAAVNITKEKAKKSELMGKIDKLSDEELRLQEKIAALKEKHDKIKAKGAKAFDKCYKSSNVAKGSLKMAQFHLLKREEKQLQQKIQRAEVKIENLTHKRQTLHEKLGSLVESLDETFEKVINLFGKKKPLEPKAAEAAAAKIKECREDIEDESETLRNEDNALAEQEADCKAQILELDNCAAAIAAVGANCDAQLGNIAAHGKHSAAVAQFQNQENAVIAKTHAAVAAAIGTSPRSSPQAQARVG